MGGYDASLNNKGAKIQWAKLGPKSIYFNTVVFSKWAVGEKRQVGAVMG